MQPADQAQSSKVITSPSWIGAHFPSVTSAQFSSGIDKVADTPREHHLTNALTSPDSTTTGVQSASRRHRRDRQHTEVVHAVTSLSATDAHPNQGRGPGCGSTGASRITCTTSGCDPRRGQIPESRRQRTPGDGYAMNSRDQAAAPEEPITTSQATADITHAPPHRPIQQLLTC